LADDPHRVDRQIVDDLIALRDDRIEQPGKDQRKRAPQSLSPCEICPRERDEHKTQNADVFALVDQVLRLEAGLGNGKHEDRHRESARGRDEPRGRPG